MTEIEIRGKINKEQFDNLFKLLSEMGELANHYHRLSLDLSPGFDPTTKTWKNSGGMDIRLKKSDDHEKISLKIGNFHDLERKEIEVKLQTGQFLEALDMLEVMGFNSGMIYFWESWEFNYLGVEIKLSKHTDDYFTFEVEGRENNDVHNVAHKLNLNPYSNDEYKTAMDWDNQNIHQIYTKDLVKKILLEKF
jgi:hypothetical protein